MKNKILMLTLVLSGLLLSSGCSFSFSVNDDNNDRNNNGNNSQEESEIDKQEGNANQNQEENVNNIISNDEANSIGQNLYDFGVRAITEKEYQFSSVYTENLGYEILNYDAVSSKFIKNSQVKSLPSSSTFGSLDSNLIKDNGKYYSSLGNGDFGRGTNQTFISTKLELTKKEENKVTFNAVSGYCVDSDFVPFDSSYVCKNIDYKTYEFIIEKEDNEWKIAKITLPF